MYSYQWLGYCGWHADLGCRSCPSTPIIAISRAWREPRKRQTQQWTRKEPRCVRPFTAKPKSDAIILKSSKTGLHDMQRIKNLNKSSDRANKVWIRVFWASLLLYSRSRRLEWRRTKVGAINLITLIESTNKLQGINSHTKTMMICCPGWSTRSCLPHRSV